MKSRGRIAWGYFAVWSGVVLISQSMAATGGPTWADVWWLLTGSAALILGIKELR